MCTTMTSNSIHPLNIFKAFRNARRPLPHHFGQSGHLFIRSNEMCMTNCQNHLKTRFSWNTYMNLLIPYLAAWNLLIFLIGHKIDSFRKTASTNVWVGQLSMQECVDCMSRIRLLQLPCIKILCTYLFAQSHVFPVNWN